MHNITDKEDGKSSLSAEQFNSLRREISNVVASTGTEFDADSFVQLCKAISEYGAAADFYTDSGVANAYVLSPIGDKHAPARYVPGMLVRFRAENANTGASTINVAALGAKSIKQADGTTALTANTITTSFDVMLRYNEAQDCFVVASTKPAGEGSVLAFDNSNLSLGILTVSHNIGQQFVTVQVFDNDNKMVLPDEVTLTSSSTCAIDLTSYGVITGTWHAVVK